MNGSYKRAAVTSVRTRIMRIIMLMNTGIRIIFIRLSKLSNLTNNKFIIVNKNYNV